MPEQDFLSRLRKGRIVQVLIVYVGASWVAVQVVVTLRDLVGLPEWVGPVTLVLLLIGLIVVAATAWVQSHTMFLVFSAAYAAERGDWTEHARARSAATWRRLAACSSRRCRMSVPP